MHLSIYWLYDLQNWQFGLLTITAFVGLGLAGLFQPSLGKASAPGRPFRQRHCRLLPGRNNDVLRDHARLVAVKPA